jgi:hypothetical protein
MPFLTRWLSQSGDTSFWSWIITFLYIITIVLTIYYVQKIKSQQPQHFLWLNISIFLIAMGINKQLDLQILVNMSGSFIARQLNLIEHRRAIQLIVAIGILITVILIGTIIIFKTRSILRQSALELSGVLILMAFALIRVASMTTYHIYIPKVHGIEFLGICIILLSLIIKIKKLITY